MDEMKITSKFTRNVISKIIKKVLKKKFGYDIDVQLDQLNATFINEKAHIRLSIDADLDQAELMKILKNIGLY